MQILIERILESDPKLAGAVRGASENEIEGLEERMDVDLPEAIWQLLRLMGKQVGTLRPVVHYEVVSGSGEAAREPRALVVGFKAMYAMYSKPERILDSERVFVGHTEGAQDLGYLYVDPADPRLEVLELTHEGELWQKHGPLMELLFAGQYPELVRQRRAELNTAG